MPSRVTPFGSEDTASNIWIDGNAITPTPCLNFYRSAMIEGYFYKECPTGQSGTGVYFQVPAGKFISQVSQEAADAAAQAYFDEQGALLANSVGACEFGAFEEVFTSIMAALNWDWISDKTNPAVSPFNSYKASTTDQAAMPMIHVGVFDIGDPVTTSDVVQYQIHPDHGMMHINFANTHPENNLLFAEVRITSGTFSQNFNPLQTLGGFLIADFGSIEIHGMDPLAEGYDPEYVPATLGGMLGIIETSASTDAPFTDDHLNGYIISYDSDNIYVRKWDAELVDYDIIETIPFSIKNKTIYFGYGIRYDQGQWAAEIYINGAWQASIFDDDITAFTMFRYQRGVLSMDYWFGDWIVASMSPFTNRVPGPLTMRYFPPTEVITQPAQVIEEFPAYFVHYKDIAAGGAYSLVDAVSDGGNLRNHAQDFLVTSEQFTTNPAASNDYYTALFLKFDLTNEATLGNRLYGNTLLTVNPILRITEATFPYAVNGIIEDLDIESPYCTTALFTNDEVEPTLPQLTGDVIYAEGRYYDEFFPVSPEDYCKRGQSQFQSLQDYLDRKLIHSFSAQAFQFTGLLYTKAELASKWIMLRMGSQAETAAVTTSFKHQYHKLMLISGVPGLRTEEILEAPVYDAIDCPGPITCADQQMLITSGVFGEGLGGAPDHLKTTNGTTCDTLFSIFAIYDQLSWNWSVSVNDIVDGIGGRHLIVQFDSLVFFGDLVFEEGQISAVLSEHPTLTLKVFRPDWPLPIFDGVLTFDSGSISVPEPPLNEGLPTETTLVYKSNAIAGEDPILAVLGSPVFKFEFYPHNPLE